MSHDLPYLMVDKYPRRRREYRPSPIAAAVAATFGRRVMTLGIEESLDPKTGRVRLSQPYMMRG